MAIQQLQSAYAPVTFSRRLLRLRTRHLDFTHVQRGGRLFRSFVFDVHPLQSSIVAGAGNPDAQVVASRQHVRDLERAVGIRLQTIADEQRD